MKKNIKLVLVAALVAACSVNLYSMVSGPAKRAASTALARTAAVEGLGTRSTGVLRQAIKPSYVPQGMPQRPYTTFPRFQVQQYGSVLSPQMLAGLAGTGLAAGYYYNKPSIFKTALNEPAENNWDDYRVEQAELERAIKDYSDIYMQFQKLSESKTYRDLINEIQKKKSMLSHGELFSRDEMAHVTSLIEAFNKEFNPLSEKMKELFNREVFSVLEGHRIKGNIYWELKNDFRFDSIKDFESEVSNMRNSNSKYYAK